MINLITLKENILNGHLINKSESLELINQPLDALCTAANEIRKHFCGTAFDMCTIINGKSGRCSENCKFCSQSAFYNTNINEYPMLNKKTIVDQAKYNDDRGVLRYSIVTSGKKLTNQEVDDMCKSIEAIKSTSSINVCFSFGLLNYDQFVKLKKAGATRVHNNLETSREYFPNICTTHTFDDKVNALKAAQKAGLTVCSGGLMGLGEGMEDRISLAHSLRELDICSVPINMLNPIPGTPFEHNKKLTNEDMRRIVAIYRFILPSASIRLAGGRGLLNDKGRACFLSGANAAISGDMLTTSGITIEDDFKMLKELGYEVKPLNSKLHATF